MPIGTDLVLNEEQSPESILLDGPRLGAVAMRAAERFRTPLAVPLMDLRIEKQAMLQALGAPDPDDEAYLLSDDPGDDGEAMLMAALPALQTPRMVASCDAIRWVAARQGFLPIGMSIGPFSLMTKLMPDCITAVYMAGEGMTGEDMPEVAALERILRMGTELILHYHRLQIQAGAKAIFICEPAANLVYISPKQIAAGSDVFDTCVMTNLRRIKEQLDRHHVDLILHDCGELVAPMIEALASLRPAMLSLGSSVKLWEAAAVVPRDVVLYGNLPSKKFYSDAEMPLETIDTLAAEIRSHMDPTGHPYILGTECDVLHVPQYAEAIRNKVARLMGCC